MASVASARGVRPPSSLMAFFKKGSLKKCRVLPGHHATQLRTPRLPGAGDAPGREPDGGGLRQMHDDDALEFSSREPTVNVYSAGGEFLAHKDHQSLTVLIPLTDPDEDFEGGGTAFWRQDSRGHRVEAHDLLLRPPKGTALLFGGYTTHAGTPVECGERCVLVASFSRRGGKAKRRMEAEQSRDIYGDLL